MTSTAFPAHLLGALDEALAYTDGTHDRATVQNALDAGILQLWSGRESFILTELKVAPTGRRSVHLFLAGGSGMDELQPLWPVVEAWARSQGAEAVTMLGRRGWEKSFLVRDEGFVPTHTFYHKALR